MGADSWLNKRAWAWPPGRGRAVASSYKAMKSDYLYRVEGKFGKLTGARRRGRRISEPKPRCKGIPYAGTAQFVDSSTVEVQLGSTSANDRVLKQSGIFAASKGSAKTAARQHFVERRSS